MTATMDEGGTSGNQRSQILSRISKMGQPMLPMTGTPGGMPNEEEMGVC